MRINRFPIEDDFTPRVGQWVNLKYSYVSCLWISCLKKEAKKEKASVTVGKVYEVEKVHIVCEASEYQIKFKDDKGNSVWLWRTYFAEVSNSYRFIMGS
ncbi:hypothetical protein N9948_02195 [bacterium]|nr:hypothetical protein [bacterium]